MISMGKTVRLKVLRDTDHGHFLTDEASELLLPRSEVPPTLQVGDEVEVFIYRDSEDRPTATLRKPFAQAGEATFLEVVDVAPFGAFARWGLLKDLLIPIGEQSVPLKVGDRVLTLVLVDETTDRLFGTTKLALRLDKNLASLKLGQEVLCQVWKPHDLGWSVVVDNRWLGLIYQSQSPEKLVVGQEVKAWISQLRPDGKIDLMLRPQGFSRSNPDARQRILDALKESGGRLPLGDKSAPEEIEKALSLSKKAFKTACGTLYKERLIEILPNEIALTS